MELMEKTVEMAVMEKRAKRVILESPSPMMILPKNNSKCFVAHKENKGLLDHRVYRANKVKPDQKVIKEILAQKGSLARKVQKVTPVLHLLMICLLPNN
jgi:hypothetical protein